MSNTRAAIGLERRRQIQIRKAFEAGLALQDADRADLTEFYLACGAYIVFSMDRLHYQDQVIHDLLAERIPADDAEAHDRLAVLNERQDKSREMVETFRQAIEVLNQTGLDGRAVFESAAHTFTAAFTSLMAPRKNPFQAHTDNLFADEDWELVAGVTDESTETENKLYKAVQASAPAGIDPETMQVVYH
ncbi:MAG: hypothetical protein OER85_00195 [Gammaproteobacteria bacterium]|nr:hypothetical protein [Gammaproteobacteria bacterium]